VIPVLEGVFGIALVGAAISQANHQTMKTHWWHRLWTVGFGMSAMWLVLSVALSMSPVLRDASAIVTPVAQGVVRVAITTTKARNCEWLRSEAYVIDTGGNMHEATMTWEGDRIKGNSRPVGRHKLEPARIEYDADIQAEKVLIQAFHTCGWMWHDTVTTQGQWGIPR